MSDTETARPSLAPALSGVGGWLGPVVKTDLSVECCKACAVPVRADRPCLWLDNVLSGAECDALLRAARPHHQGYCSAGGVSTDPGSRSQFTSDDPELAAILWERIQDTVPVELDGGQAVGLLQKVAHAKYFPGQVGFQHFDFRHRDPGRGDCTASRISFTLYLDDDFAGGEIGFLSKLHMDILQCSEHKRLKPRRGSAVLFYQGVPEFAHYPHQVSEGCKHILRADVVYRFATKDDADVACSRVS